MRRIKLTIEYDGTDFVGWQRQDNGPSIQAALEDALAEMTGAKTIVRGAGRTDAGVHARAQVAHFDTESQIPLHGFQRGLSSIVPRAIAVRAAEEVAPDFDARFSARGKLYRYQVWNAPSRSPLHDRYAWWIRGKLDCGKMQQAASALVGKHDFAAYRASDCERKTTVRTVTRLDVTREHDELVSIEIEADAFLKNMVRIIAGTLVDIGSERLPVEQTAIALAARDRTLAGQTAPAHGLTLMRVDY